MQSRSGYWWWLSFVVVDVGGDVVEVGEDDVVVVGDVTKLQRKRKQVQSSNNDVRDFLLHIFWRWWWEVY